MESTPSYIPHKFYCHKCKQEYPFSSKEYHCFLCGGEQINNNTIIPILTIKETLSLKLLKKFDIVVLLFFN